MTERNPKSNSPKATWADLAQESKLETYGMILDGRRSERAKFSLT